MWLSLGTKTITDYDWQTFDPPLIYGLGYDVGLFKITHSWPANHNPVGKLWFGSYFDGVELWALFQANYPYKNEGRLIHSPVPPSFVRAGLQERFIGVKADNRTRWYDGSPWTVSLEYYQPDTPTEGEQLLTDIDQTRAEVAALNQQVAGLTQVIVELQASMN